MKSWGGCSDNAYFLLKKQQQLVNKDEKKVCCAAELEPYPLLFQPDFVVVYSTASIKETQCLV